MGGSSQKFQNQSHKEGLTHRRRGIFSVVVLSSIVAFFLLQCFLVIYLPIQDSQVRPAFVLSGKHKKWNRPSTESEETSSSAPSAFLKNSHNLTLSEARMRYVHVSQARRKVQDGNKSSSSSWVNLTLVSPLTDFDREYYTVRINTWRRPEQLIVSVNHLASCDGVTQIQVVWCDTENEPPHDVTFHPSGKVVVEFHPINSLNERFHITTAHTPTLGILSIDDDVMRPCLALDAGFLKWTRYPHRMVGYDGRIHRSRRRVSSSSSSRNNNNNNEDVEEWFYGYLSESERTNSYSMSLTRFCFLHRDYLDQYYYSELLPRKIFDRVTRVLNCEDIAMSFFISALTGGNPPLLADYWATQSLVKLFTEKSIHSNSQHAEKRNECVNEFAELLGLKGNQTGLPNPTFALKTAPLRKKSIFQYGISTEPWEDEAYFNSNVKMSPRMLGFLKELKSWNMTNFTPKLRKRSNDTMREALSRGLIENTPEWEERWRMKK